MGLTIEQAQWIVNNIFWLHAVYLIIFISLVMGFWKLVGLLIKKIKGKKSDTTDKQGVDTPFPPVKTTMKAQGGNVYVKKIPEVPYETY